MDRVKKILPHPRRLLSRRGLLAALALAFILAGAALGLTRSPQLASRAEAAGTPKSAPSALAPTRLLALPSSRIANGTARLKVTLGAPISPATPLPMLTPRDAGSWKAEGNSLVFTPASTLSPCAHYRLTVWARTASTGHAILGRRRVETLEVACPPTAALQQALARLGYLGARFHPRYIFHEPARAISREEAALHAYHPPRGGFAPSFRDAPAVHAGQFEAVTRGALTVYQADRGLQATGEANTATWESLLYDLSHYRRDTQPYTWVTVRESLPQTLEVHRGAHVALTTPVNTGVPGAETALGMYPIYARYVSTTMSGTDVDGTKYVVPDVPWVNYFNGGDAVHGYPRASYGFPQSNGCVELPIEAAHTVFGMLQLGDIVWVS